MKILLALLCTAVALVTGCSSSSQPAGGEQQGRGETKTLEGASAVGYDGKAIRKSVDHSLNNNDAHNQELDKELKTDGAGQQKP